MNHYGGASPALEGLGSPSHRDSHQGPALQTMVPGKPGTEHTVQTQSPLH